jgi:hypothetical protein
LLGPIDAAPQGDGRHSVKEELGNLDIATSKITDDLLSLAMHVEKEIDTRLSNVLNLEAQILNTLLLQLCSKVKRSNHIVSLNST